MKLFQKGELNLLWPFYLDSLISPMFYLIPAFYIIYFINLEFSMFQIGILMSASYLTMLLFEIPTGSVADLYGRKFSVLLGNIICAVAFILMFFFTSFYSVLILLALTGFGATFSSGAHEAWTTDLINKNKKSLLRQFFMKRMSIDSLGLVISGLIGAFLVKEFGLSIIWPVTGASFIVSFFILLFAKESFIKKNFKLSNSLKKVNKQSLKSINYAKNHPILFYFLLTSMVWIIAGGFASEISWVPFLQGLNFPEHAFGYLWSAMAMIGIIAPLSSSFFSKKGKERQFLLTIMIIITIITIPIILVNNIIAAFIILFPLLFLTGLAKPIERVYFHRYIPSKLRAGVGGVESMILSVAGIITAPLVGISIDYLGPRTTIFLSAILMIPAIIIFSRIKKD